MEFKKSDPSITGLTCFDFVPKNIRPNSLLHWPQFEPFATLLEPANAFLRTNPHLIVRNCETIHFRVENDHIKNQDDSDFTEIGVDVAPFVKVLRLWVQPRQDGGEDVQQLGYVTFLPSTSLEDKQNPQTLQGLTNQVNAWLKQNPLPGQILSVESFEMRGVDGVVDADSTSWKISTPLVSLLSSFLQCLRIFYITGEPRHEEIGFADFLPAVLEPGGDHNFPTVQQFPMMINSVNRWLSTLPENVRLANIQTILCRAHEKTGIPIHMYTTFRTDLPLHNYFLRYLRVVFIIPLHEPTAPPSYLKRQIHTKLFVPGLVRDPTWYRFGKFERQGIVKERLDSWIWQTQARVVTVETVIYKPNNRGERHEGFAACHTWHARYDEKNQEQEPVSEQCLVCYRVYLEDDTVDPPGFSWPKTSEDYQRELSEKWLRVKTCT